MADPWTWVDPWSGGETVRAVRHQIANLLSPVTVAAELLDGDSDELDMLRRSVAKLTRHLARTGELLRAPQMHLVDWDAAELAAALAVPGNASGSVSVDAALIAERVCDELAQGGEAELVVRSDRVRCPDGVERDLFIIESCADTEPLTAEQLKLLAVPLSSRRVGVGLAIAAHEIHRHGGWMRGRTDMALIQAVLPLRPHDPSHNS